MAQKRVILELGTGNDLHGGDYTKAALRAVQDALHHSSLTMLRALKVNSKTHMFVNVTIGVQQPDKVDLEKVKASLPYGIVTVKNASPWLVPELYIHDHYGGYSHEMLDGNAMDPTAELMTKEKRTIRFTSIPTRLAARRFVAQARIALPVKTAPVQLSKRRSSPSRAMRRATCSAMRALTPEPVGLRSTWRPAKMQTLRLGSSRPSPPSVRIVP